MRQMAKLNPISDDSRPSHDELERLRAENHELRNENNELKARFTALEVLADTDTLTPLPNRRCLIRELDRVIRHVTRYKTCAALLFVDVNGLKKINDTYGHSAGDATLIHVAQLLRSTLRSTDLVARIGGDEFGLLLDPIDPDAVIKKVATLHRLIALSPYNYGKAAREVGISIGHTIILKDDTIEQILERADTSMYSFKRDQRSDK